MLKIDGGIMTTDLRRVGQVAAHAESLGYDGLWSAEAGHDPYLPLAVAAGATDHVTLGTNITVAFPRSPMVHAQIAWDLQAASQGRFVLGLGTQVKGHNERRYSTPWTPPGPRLREMIQLLRHIWDVWQNGTKPSFQGKHYQFSLMTPFFSPAPIEWPDIPIWIAAVNPYMLTLAGELCDGVHVHPFHSEKYVRETVLPNVEAGLKKSGRTRSAITLSTSAFVIGGKDREEIQRAKAAVRQQLSFYASTRSYEVVLQAHGWGEVCHKLNEKAAKGDWAGMGSLVTDEMLAVYAVEGVWDDIPALLRKKYSGLLDRIAFYMPMRPSDESDTFWSEFIAACRRG
jgi:probable F420-dependent oxidoreductase